jgi:hypothetical protein
LGFCVLAQVVYKARIEEIINEFTLQNDYQSADTAEQINLSEELEQEVDEVQVKSFSSFFQTVQFNLKVT